MEANVDKKGNDDDDGNPRKPPVLRNALRNRPLVGDAKEESGSKRRPQPRRGQATKAPAKKGAAHGGSLEPLMGDR
ncbi:MAG: hypothetical protein WCI05_11025, partial [Myxococcales bacterium]